MNPEDRLVEKIRSLAPGSPSLTIGPGDDAAVISRDGGLLAATTDMLVEGVDFLPDEEPERVGRRAASVNLSDLAAMGAEPEFFLLSIAVPPARGEEVPLAIARGAIARSASYGAALAGGDLSAAPLLVVSIAFWGRPVGQPLTRSGASPGELVYVSGHPGEAAAGLRIAGRVFAFASGDSHPPHFAELAAEHEQRLLGAFRDPEPRIALGAFLARERLATAAIDISDGLGVDAGRLARSSGVRVTLEKERLPISAALLAFAGGESNPPHFAELAPEHERRLLAAFRDPEPRVALGAFLARERLATAAIDISDGLGIDAGRLARASGVRLTLEKDRLPISPPLLAFAAAEDLDPIELAIGGGDDYELLFTVREADAPRLAEGAGKLGVTLRAVGRTSPGQGIVLADARGERDIEALGHDHFEKAR